MREILIPVRMLLLLLLTMASVVSGPSIAWRASLYALSLNRRRDLGRKRTDAKGLLPACFLKVMIAGEPRDNIATLGS